MAKKEVAKTKYSYKIKKKNKDIRETIVEKGGISIDLTLNELIADIRSKNNKIKMCKTEMIVPQKLVDGYTEASPKIAKLVTDNNVKVMYEFVKAKLSIYEREHLIGEYRKIVKENIKELREFCEALGLDSKEYEKEIGQE